MLLTRVFEMRGDFSKEADRTRDSISTLTTWLGSELFH